MRQALRNSFLVTTAAAALVTGITIASAQSTGGGGGGGGGGMSGPTTSSGERHQGSSGGGSPGRAQSSGGSLSTQGHPTENRSTETRPGKAIGEERNERGKALGEQKSNNQPGNKERSEQLGRGERNERLGTDRGERTERLGRGERNERLGTERGERTERFGTTRTERGPGFAREHGGRSVELSSDQRTRIHDVFTRDRDRFNRFRVGRVDFDLRPGVRIPRHFHLFGLPSDIVTVVPEYRGYRFFYYEDEIVIVDPVTLEIVAIIPA
jgi:hypothetical protein